MKIIKIIRMTLLIIPEDVIKNEIIIYLDIQARSRFARCSKLLYNLVGKIHEDTFSIYGNNPEKRKRRLAELRHNNELWKIIKEYPNLCRTSGKIDWNAISSNPNTTWDIIKDNIGFPEKHGGRWSWGDIGRNPNVTWDIIQSSPKCLENGRRTWNWYTISQNINMTMDLIEYNLQDSSGRMIWDWHGICLNPNLTLKFIQKYIDSPYRMSGKSSWNDIVKNPGITIAMLEEIFMMFNYPDAVDEFMQFSRISANPNLTLDFIRKYRDEKWNWDSICENPGMTLEIIENNPTFPDSFENNRRDREGWCWEGLSWNPNIVKILEKYLVYLSKPKVNKCLFDILGDPKGKLNWCIISQNSDITLEFIKNNPTFPKKFGDTWNWFGMSQNPNLTLEFIKNNPTFPDFSDSTKDQASEWNWGGISYNTFGN